MPFQQPAPIIIRQTHFRGRTYTFPVESVLAPGSGGGLLHLEASEGYLVATSANRSLQVEQTIPYIQQPDGSWLVSDKVSLTVSVNALISGSVTLLDPLGETLSLPIRIAPSLFVDSSEISFDETKLGDSTATILNIRQRGALTPIHLSVEPKNQFAIADAKTAMISASTLTLTPSFEGSNIIVIYKPNRAGRNAAKITINTPYEIKIVQLLGQPGGILGLVRWPEIPNIPLPTMPRWQWPDLPRLQRPKLPRLPMPKMPRLQLPEIPRLALLDSPHFQPSSPSRLQMLAISIRTYRGPIIGGLAALAFGAMVWMGYGMLTQPETKTEVAARSQSSAEAQLNNATPGDASFGNASPSRKVDKPVSQPLSTTLEEPVITSAETSVPVEPPTPKPVPQPKEAVVSKKNVKPVELEQSGRIELARSSRPKPVKPVLTSSVKSAAFTVEQVSDLEKELNASTSLKQP